MSKQITSLTFFRFETRWSRLWAFFMMQFARAPLKKVEGLERFFLMGTGKPGFNPSPDWKTYALVQVWRDQQAADYFFNSHPTYSAYVRQSAEVLRVMMRNLRAHGEWNAENPFRRSSDIDPHIPYIAAITRATIKTHLQFKFWRAVPDSQRYLIDNPGLLMTKGIGEVPFRNMATFSIWRSEEALKDFAYSNAHHKKAIEQTRAFNWYKEELFSRFQPYQVYGTYQGAPLDMNLAHERQTTEK
jgi:heme-degrading monooxygenase HmoA